MPQAGLLDYLKLAWARCCAVHAVNQLQAEVKCDWDIWADTQR